MIDQEKITEFQARLAGQRERFNTLAEWHLNVYIGTDGEIEPPYSGEDTYVSLTEYKEDNYQEIDTEATLAKLAAIAKYASKQEGVKVEKDYSDNFTLKITIKDEYPRIVLRYYSDREAVCSKKVVGTKVVPATTYPERVEEVVEWDCEKISLLAK